MRAVGAPMKARAYENAAAQTTAAAAQPAAMALLLLVAMAARVGTTVRDLAASLLDRAARQALIRAASPAGCWLAGYGSAAA